MTKMHFPLSHNKAMQLYIHIINKNQYTHNTLRALVSSCFFLPCKENSTCALMPRDGMKLQLVGRVKKHSNKQFQPTAFG